MSNLAQNRRRFALAYRKGMHHRLVDMRVNSYTRCSISCKKDGENRSSSFRVFVARAATCGLSAMLLARCVRRIWDAADASAEQQLQQRQRRQRRRWTESRAAFSAAKSVVVTLLHAHDAPVIPSSLQQPLDQHVTRIIVILLPSRSLRVTSMCSRRHSPLCYEHDVCLFVRKVGGLCDQIVQIGTIQYRWVSWLPACGSRPGLYSILWADVGKNVVFCT